MILTEITAPNEVQNLSTTQPDLPAAPASLIRDAVIIYLRQYFNQSIGGAPPTDLYAQVMSEIEPPLLEMTLRYCNYNQVQTAKRLAISRGTLRKKMQQHKLFDNGKMS